MTQPIWRKSSHSGTDNASDCVEVAELIGGVGIRDSKNPVGPSLLLTATDWRTLLRQIKTR